MVTIGIIATVMMTLSGVEIACARGGGAKGGGSCDGSGPGKMMSQAANNHQYQYRQQKQGIDQQDKGTANTWSKSEPMQRNQNQSRSRKQLRDPNSHVFEKSD
jgi:hypothetical protein